MTKKPAPKKAIDKISKKTNPPTPKGGRRPGSGRPKGAVNKKTKEVIAAVEATGETPLAYMLRVMRDSFAEAKRRDAMAQSAAPYIHPRLAQLTHSGEINIKAWSDEQLAAARAVLGAITAPHRD